jgi:hypothetical protein
MTKLCIPEKILDQHLVVLGKTGSGKSSVLRHIVEWLLAQKKRVAIIDPKGDWWGLKSSADGRSAGFPVIAFGDFKESKATDVPINAQSGKHVAELIATGNRPCVVGFRGWMPGQMTNFWIDFASTLFNANAGELFLVVDEVHNFAPKGKIMDPAASKCLHWTNRMMSEGRGLGLVCLSASQRPQKVHNDTLTSCETLVAMRVIHAADREAVKKWIDGAGDKAQGAEVLATLAQLPRGEAWVWSPEIKFGPERVKFPMFKTFDSFAPPQLQRKVSNSGWADVDLAAVKEKLASVIEEQKANDPKALRSELTQVKLELAKLKSAKPAPAPPAVKTELKTIEKPVLKDGQLKRAEATLEKLNGVYTKASELQLQAKSMCDSISAAITLTKQSAPAAPQVAPVAVAQRFTMCPPPRPAVAKPAKAVATADGEDLVISKPQQRILDSVAWFNSVGVASPSRIAVGFKAKIKPTGGHFDNTIGPLSRHGLITYPVQGSIALTDVGRAVAQAPKAAATMAAYHDAIRDVLQKGAVINIFNAVAAGGGASLTNEQIGEATGINPTGGHFDNSIGPLGTLGLVQRKSGVVSPTELMFPPSLIGK